MDEQTTGRNLPAIVTNVGGALQAVLSWSQHLEVLSREQMYQIAEIVRANPQLANETAVDMLADAAGYHNQPLDRWFEELVERHGMERVYYAIDLFRELGISTKESAKMLEGARADDGLFVVGSLEAALDFLELLAAGGWLSEQVEDCCKCIEDLGGWGEASVMTSDEIAEVLGRSSFEEVIECDEEEEDLGDPDSAKRDDASISDYNDWAGEGSERSE